MKTRRIQTGLVGIALLFGLSQPAFGDHIKAHSGARITLERQKGDNRAVIRIRSHEPFFGFPPTGFIYDGPPYYAPPFLYYPSYPYNPSPPYRPYASQGSQGPIPQGVYDERVIPAGKLTLLVDPVATDVFIDGLRLTQRGDLTYEVALLSGNHLVSARAEGYAPYEETIEIPKNRRIVLTIRLARENQSEP